MFKFNLRSFLTKEWKFLRLSASFIFITGAYSLMAFITLVFAGHMNQAHLAGVGLTNTLFNVAVTSVSSGYSSIFDTYGPQVHGSEKKSELGTLLFKCLLQGTLVNLIIAGPYLNLVFIIDLLPDSGLYSDTPDLGDPGEDYKDIVVAYLRMTLVAEYLDYTLVMISKYFAIQGYDKFVYLVTVVMVGCNILFNYILVTVFQLGIDGLSLAAILGRLLPLLVSLTVCFVMVKRGKFSWNGFSSRALLGWKPMVKLGLAGAIECFAESFLYEIAVFLSQFDGADALSVVIIMYQLTIIWWAVAYGMARASATLIGMALGEGDTNKTRYFMKLSLLNSILVSTTLAIICYSLRNEEVLMFSSDGEVKALFLATIWVACLDIPLNNLQVSLNQGILVAFGYQEYTAWSMSIVCYLIGLPIMLITIFLSDLRVSGIFLGAIIVDVIMIVTASLKIWTVDIDNEINNSKERVDGDKGKSRDCVAGAETSVNEIYDNPTCSVKYDANDKTVRTQETATNNDKASDPNDDILEDSLEEDQGRDLNADFKEIRKVLLAFMAAVIFCVSLAGISLIRQ